MVYKTVRHEIQVRIPDCAGFMPIAHCSFSRKDVARERYLMIISKNPDLDFRILRIETVTTVLETTTENNK